MMTSRHLFLWILLLWVWAAGSRFAEAQTLTKEQIAQANIEQRLKAQIPLNTTFRDEAGQPVRLGTFFGERPVVLVLAYYECPNLCNLVLNGLMESARNLHQEAGRDFEIVVVSINPHEQPALAAAKKQTYVTRYGRPHGAQGWHFLTGESAAIEEVANAVGFRYLYDEASKQYAHGSGIVVATPAGVVSRYLLGIEYPPKDLRLALTEASTGKIGSLANRLLLLCFHYDPNTGRYSLLIARVIQFAGIGTVLILSFFIYRMAHPKREATKAGAGACIAFALLPERASDVAGSVDAIFYALLVLCSLVILAIVITIIVFCIRYRDGSQAQRQAKERAHGFEIAWTSVTMLIFVAIFFWAAVVYVRMSQPPANAMEIHVVGKQWMWKAQHPNGRREINELHLLLGQPVKLLMTSQDVIHDFFVPAFRTKQDVLPGRYTILWFTPTKPGKYRLYCAEYCGLDHSRMGGWVHVLEPVEYSRWLAEEPSGESVVAAGARLFQARGCSGCHAPNANSTIRAPLLTGIYRKPVPLTDGSVVTADDQYLQDSILLPNKQIAAGYEPRMPTFQGQLSEEEVMQLVAYIKSLGSGNGGRP